MAQSVQPIEMRDLEIGFYRGLARALDGGLEYNEIVRDRAAVLDKIKEVMEKISSDAINNGERLPNWSSRGVRHAAENITTFEIAWRVERPPKSNSMKEDEMRDYLRVFRTRGNCWSHR